MATKITLRFGRLVSAVYRLKSGMVAILHTLRFPAEMRCVIMTLLIGCSVTPGQSTILTKNQYKPREGLAPKLQLTTIIAKTFSCSSDDSDRHYFAIDLRLTIRNSGDEAAIIDKRSFWVGSRVSTGMREAVNKKYIEKTSGDMWGLMPKQPKDLSDFVILKPGETYDFEKVTRISFLVNNESKAFAGLVPGSYWLQVDFATWTYLEDPRKFREIWRDKGFLWFQGLTSEPMRFTIEQDYTPMKCS